MRLEQKARGGKACAHPQRVRGQPARRGASVRCRVLSPPREEAEAVVRSSPEPSTSVDINVVRRPVSADMEQLVENLLNVVGNRHPMLMAAAQQIFGAGGKKLRPMLVFLVARATTKHMNGGCEARASSLQPAAVLIGTAPLPRTRSTRVVVSSPYVRRVAACTVGGPLRAVQLSMRANARLCPARRPEAALNRERACSDDITQRHRRLAEITEMIHTASLVHDDVLDECDTRRGARQPRLWLTSARRFARPTHRPDRRRCAKVHRRAYMCCVCVSARGLSGPASHCTCASRATTEPPGFAHSHALLSELSSQSTNAEYTALPRVSARASSLGTRILFVWHICGARVQQILEIRQRPPCHRGSCSVCPVAAQCTLRQADGRRCRAMGPSIMPLPTTPQACAVQGRRR